MNTIGNLFLWSIFASMIVIMLAIDLFLQQYCDMYKISIKQTVTWSLVWIIFSLLFCTTFCWYLILTKGSAIAYHQTLAFLTSYLVEKTLAIDNIFVWLMLFSYFAVPIALQRRVLVYGVLGAIILRTVMVFAGSWLIGQFKWLLYVCGIFLLFVGVKIVREKENEININEKLLIKWLRNHFHITNTIDDERFFIYKNGLLYATPLLLVLISIEISDIVFAFDSIPAIFAITTDPFIVLTSSLFATLGLRTMYFLLADIAKRFLVLKYGMSMILIFIGIKMLIVNFYYIPITVSLGIVFSILALTLIISALIHYQHNNK